MANGNQVPPGAPVAELGAVWYQFILATTHGRHLIRTSYVLVFCFLLAGADVRAEDLINAPCGVILTGDALALGGLGPDSVASINVATGARPLRITFLTTFDVTRIDGAPAADAVADVIGRWIGDRRALTTDERMLFASALDASAQAASPTHVYLSGPRILLGITGEGSAGAIHRRRTVTLTVPDRKTKGQYWRTVITTTNLEAGGARVTIERAVGREGAGFARAIGFGGRPGLIDRLLEDDRLRVRSGAMSLKPFPLTLSTRDVDAFLATVDDVGRTQPLVYVSLALNTRTALVDVERLAERLRGFASVVVEHADDHDARLPVTAMLRDALGGRHAYDGMVRVFGPGGADDGWYRPDPRVRGSVVLEKIVSLAARAYTRRADAAHDKREAGTL